MPGAEANQLPQPAPTVPMILELPLMSTGSDDADKVVASADCGSSQMIDFGSSQMIDFGHSTSMRSATTTGGTTGLWMQNKDSELGSPSSMQPSRFDHTEGGLVFHTRTDLSTVSSAVGESAGKHNSMNSAASRLSNFSLARQSTGGRSVKCAPSSPSSFPTYCLHIDDFQTLGHMQAHEDVLCQLIVPTDDMIMHFISHEWLGFTHPDPDRIQLACMQGIFRRIAEGEANELFDEQQLAAFLSGASVGTSAPMRVFEGQLVPRMAISREELPTHIHSGCVWLDYHSIPQDPGKSDFMNAVNSIPFYVERCDHFWICAPPAIHADLHEVRDLQTWRNRGWCRLEETTNLLSRTLKMPVVVTNQTRTETYGFLDGLQYYYGRPERAAMNGKFTCCVRGHKVQLEDGTIRRFPCDKEVIMPILEHMFQTLFECEGGNMSALKRNSLAVAAPAFFAGDKSKCFSQGETAEQFCERAGFESLDDVDKLGWTPLLWAACMADIQVAKEIAAKRPGLTLIRPSIPVRLSILSCGIWRPPSEFAQLLDLDERYRDPAELDIQTPLGYTPVDRAAKYGFHENLRTMLALGAAVDPVRKDNGDTPLLSAAREGYPLCCQALLEYGCKVNSVDKEGKTALHLACNSCVILGNPEPEARLQVIKVLLIARIDVLAKDKDGSTAIDVAMQHNFTTAVSLLTREYSLIEV